jgi:tetratricopeptide (TPR) repeat protein
MLIRRNKHLLQWLIVFTLALAMFAFIGCDDDEAGDTEEPLEYTSEVRAGWEEFENLNYDSALVHFENAIVLRSDGVDAYTGAGWCYFRMMDLENARTQWNVPLTNQYEGDVDNIYSGLGFLSMAQQNWLQATERFEWLVENNSSYSFAHEPGLDLLDVIWGLAQSYLMLGEFETSLDWVQLIEPNFETDLNTAEGRDALARMIQEIGERVQG